MPTFRRIADQRGFTLVELMIGVTIGMLIVAGLSMLFANTSASRNELEKSSRMIENGRYATELLRDEIQMAGFYDILGLPPGATYSLVSPCDTGNLGFATTPSITVPVPLRGFDGAWPADCGNPHSGSDHHYRAGTDVLLVRRVSSDTPIAPTAGNTATMYLQASACSKDPAATPFVVALGKAAAFTLHDKKPNPTTECNVGAVRKVRALVSRIFFIADCNVCTGSGADSTPTLKMLDLTNGALTEVALVEGIENMQIEYRVDAVKDGIADQFGKTAGAVADWSNVMAVDIHLLARNTDLSPGHTDNRDYTLGSTTDLATARSSADKKFKRHAFTITVRASNNEIQREKP